MAPAGATATRADSVLRRRRRHGNLAVCRPSNSGRCWFRRFLLSRAQTQRRSRGCSLLIRAGAEDVPWRRSSGRGTARRGGRRRPRMAPPPPRSTTRGRRGCTSRTPSRCSSSAPAFSCKRPRILLLLCSSSREQESLVSFRLCHRVRTAPRLMTEFLRVRKGLWLGKYKSCQGYQVLQQCQR
jgi:hypothetical protein